MNDEITYVPIHGEPMRGLEVFHNSIPRSYLGLKVGQNVMQLESGFQEEDIIEVGDLICWDNEHLYRIERVGIKEYGRDKCVLVQISNESVGVMTPPESDDGSLFDKEETMKLFGEEMKKVDNKTNIKFMDMLDFIDKLANK